LEDSFAALKHSLTNMSSSTSENTSNLDTGAIMLRINLLNDEINKKADKVEMN